MTCRVSTHPTFYDLPQDAATTGNSQRMPETYRLIDLFAGAGGMTQGFVDAGFEPVFAVEKEADFAATYAANFGSHIVARDIVDVCRGPFDLRADVVIGGPPCQGFSNLTGNRTGDKRREMWRYFMDIVERSECRVFVIENVPNLLTSTEGQAIIRKARRLGFDIGPHSCGVLCAADFGVPQNRRRAILMGSKVSRISLPQPSGTTRTVRQAFRRIPLKPTRHTLPPTPVKTSQLHLARNPTELSLKRYRLIPPGGNRFDLQRAAPELTPPCWIRKTQGGTDLFGRLEWDGPARCTIRTEFYKPEKGRYLHPSEHRPITHWEAARLQTFPDSFLWHGTRIRIAIQIGNAVPPTFAAAIGRHVLEHLQEAASLGSPVQRSSVTESV